MVVLTTLILFVLIRIKSNNRTKKNPQSDTDERNMTKALTFFGILAGIAIMIIVLLSFHPEFILELIVTYITMMIMFIVIPLKAIMKNPNMRNKIVQGSQESIYDVMC